MNHDGFSNTVNKQRIPNQKEQQEHRYHESNKGDTVPEMWFQNKSKSYPQLQSVKRNYVEYYTGWHGLVIQRLFCWINFWMNIDRKFSSKKP